jgi:hypothetical protein
MIVTSFEESGNADVRFFPIYSMTVRKPPERFGVTWVEGFPSSSWSTMKDIGWSCPG